MRCSSCRYYDKTARKPGADTDDTGMCRFPAPVVTERPNQPPWPFCKATDWCSKFAACES